MVDTIDEYVAEFLTPKHRDIVNAVRDLVRAEAPHLRETISRGSPAWKGNRIVAIVSRSRTHITLAFTSGARFTDRHGLLEGVGRTTRHVRLRDPDAFPAAPLRDYLAQAVALDEG